MIENKQYPVQTRTVFHAVMSRLMTAGLPATMQVIGAFVDNSKGELAQVTGNYFLARISHERSYSIAAVYREISHLAYNSLGRMVQGATQDQLERVKVLIYQSLVDAYGAQYPVDFGQWEHCRLVQTSDMDFTINASRTTQEPRGINEPVYNPALFQGSPEILQRAG